MKNISNFDQFVLLNEGVNLGPGGLKIDIIKASDDPGDDFMINRSKDYYKKILRKVPVFFGFEPNPARGFTEGKITDMYNSIKVRDASDIPYEEDLRKLVILTSPASIHFNKILVPESSSVLNLVLAKKLAQKYGGLSEGNIVVAPKIKYYPDEMINLDKYERAHPVTRSIVDSWLKCVKNKFDGTQIVIKKSGYDGECGLKSGGRVLLNPVFDIPNVFSSGDRVLIVDDFLIGGTTIAEISKGLIEQGVSPSNIYGYVLGVKRSSKDEEE